MGQHVEDRAVGEIYGTWTVVAGAGAKQYHYGQKVVRRPLVLARCGCGREKIVILPDLRRGKSTKCGTCKGVQAAGRLPHHSRSGNGRWRGEGAIPGRLIGQIRDGARVRELQYLLPDGFLGQLWEDQKGKCALTGLDMVIPPSKTKGYPTEQRQRFASLDRIDSAVGYVPQNVRWVCSTVNLMKQSMSDEDLLRFCKAIVAFKETT